MKITHQHDLGKTWFVDALGYRFGRLYDLEANKVRWTLISIVGRAR